VLVVQLSWPTADMAWVIAVYPSPAQSTSKWDKFPRNGLCNKMSSTASVLLHFSLQQNRFISLFTLQYLLD